MHFIEQPKHIFNNTRKLNKEIFYWNNKNNSQNFLATLSSWVAVVHAGRKQSALVEANSANRPRVQVAILETAGTRKLGPYQGC